MGKFIKLDAAGAQLQDDADVYVAVLDTTTNLAWSVSETKPMTHKQAEVTIAKLVERGLAGANDWRLPTVQELLSLVDYTKYRPAIDPVFSDCHSDLYWTSTPAAYSPGDYSWIVDFYHGDSGWDPRDNKYFVRAVRSASPAAASQ